MAPKARSRSPRGTDHWVVFGVRVDFAITEKPTALDLRFRDDGCMVPWPVEWDALFAGPDPPRAPGPQLCYWLFDQHSIFVDFLRNQPAGRFPRNTSHEFQIRKLDPAGAQWEIELVFLGRGAKGKGKGQGAAMREAWAYGHESFPPRLSLPGLHLP